MAFLRKQAVCGGLAVLLCLKVEATSPRGTGDTLVQPAKRTSSGGLLETALNVDSLTILDGILSLETRAYEGSLPGPTLRVKPGDTVRITLNNNLGTFEPVNATTKPDVGADLAQPHDANVTNLHTHGLMVSAEGNADNVAMRVLPGETKVYEYVIPAGHPSGFLWYHPHVRGSSTLQVAGGMAGGIVVEDDPATTPAELAAAREVILVLQHFSMGDPARSGDLTYNKKKVHDDLKLEYSDVLNYSDPEATQWWNFVLTNGQYIPTMTMTNKELVRLRLVNAGYHASMEVTIAGCEMHVLAHDGVYRRTGMKQMETLGQ